MGSVYDYVEVLNGCQSLEDINAVCQEFCRLHGYKHFHYGYQALGLLNKPEFLFLNGCPDEWWQRYSSEQHMCVDPVVRHCMSSVTPLVWDQIDRSDKINGDLSVMHEKYDFGLRNGFSIPIHGVRGSMAMFSVVPEQGGEMSISQMEFLNLFSRYLHEAMLRVGAVQREASDSVNLSEREKECLLWAAEGKTSWETAQILNISERTVLFHFKNIMKKFGVGNRTQAVARALMSGALTL